VTFHQATAPSGKRSCLGLAQSPRQPFALDLYMSQLRTATQLEFEYFPSSPHSLSQLSDRSFCEHSIVIHKDTSFPQLFLVSTTICGSRGLLPLPLHSTNVFMYLKTWIWSDCSLHNTNQLIRQLSHTSVLPWWLVACEWSCPPLGGFTQYRRFYWIGELSPFFYIRTRMLEYNVREAFINSGVSTHLQLLSFSKILIFPSYFFPFFLIPFYIICFFIVISFSLLSFH